MTGAEWQSFLLEMDGGNWSGGGGGSGASEKEKYCKLLEGLSNFLQGALAGAPITGTASTGYSLGVVFEGIAGITILSAYRDIEDYYDIGIHPLPIFGSLINWQQASIDWDYSGYTGNGAFAAEHVFAGWVKSQGLGDGSSALTDPDPSTGCP